MNGIPNSFDNKVGLFFIVNNEFLFHGCLLNEAEPYGDFLNYTFSHDEIWMMHYQKKYHVDFDYYPRGRIVYNKAKQHYIIYYDVCIENEAIDMQGRFTDNICQISRDEHYQCHKCYTEYVI